MALSNWDTCAFDTEGKPCNGTIQRKYDDGKSASVEIYKNWVYVRDEAMWAEHGSYVKPTIAEVNDGRCTISKFRIYAKRGPQNAILVFVETGWKHSKDPKNEYSCMCGIGCYGFGNKEWVGVLPTTLEALKQWLQELKEDYIVDQEYLDLIQKSDALRFNQGDGYFADRTGKDDLGQVTKIGEARTPIFMQLIGAKEGSDDSTNKD